MASDWTNPPGPFCTIRTWLLWMIGFVLLATVAGLALASDGVFYDLSLFAGRLGVPALFAVYAFLWVLDSLHVYVREKPPSSES